MGKLVKRDVENLWGLHPFRKKSTFMVAVPHLYWFILVYSNVMVICDSLTKA